MKIFVSYSSARRELALRLKLALEAEGHDVFFDRDDLDAGEAFHESIRSAIDACERTIFLISPESVAPGSYTLAELALVERRWPRPAGYVLPVVVAPTPKGSIPPYLLAVTLLEPRGEPVAETLAALAAMDVPDRGRLRRRVLWGAAAVVVVALTVFGYRQLQTQQAAAEEQARLDGAAQRALALCSDGNPSDGFAQLAALAQQAAAPPSVQRAQQDCAMHWLRRARVTEGHSNFEQLVAPLKPPLLQALVAGASGERAADLRAHLGWADYLVTRDGRNMSLDPIASYRQALQDDAGNVYAHAMWAHALLMRSGERREEALVHFDAALKSGRDRAFVRTLQLGAMLGNNSLVSDTLRVLDQMRQGGEALDADRGERIWSSIYGGAYRESDARRLLASLPPDDGLKTFLWLLPRAHLTSSRLPLWRLMHGLLLINAGQAAQARPDLLALQQELRAARSTGPLIDSVDRALASP